MIDAVDLLRWKKMIREQDFSFEELVMDIFQYQAANNPVYNTYLSLIRKKSNEIKQIEDIPFLPIRFFKSHTIKSNQWYEQKIFESSGTTQSMRSKHFIKDLDWYCTISTNCFEENFGKKITDVLHVGLLPSYSTNPNSSLLYMIDHFINEGGGGYFHSDNMGLVDFVSRNSDKHIFLWGVSYSLFQWQWEFPTIGQLTVIETGGMKGKEREMTRQELHEKIKISFHVDNVASEYGMTELLSQSYATANGIFYPSKTLRILPRSLTDPFKIEKKNMVAVANCIDLANVDTCSFIATDDLCKVYDDDSFEILGRIDHSDLRGCNMLS